MSFKLYLRKRLHIYTFIIAEIKDHPIQYMKMKKSKGNPLIDYEITINYKYFNPS